MKKIGFVVPWYGDAIPGGAEMETRSVAKHLIAAGLDIEILTTCVKDFTSNWNHNYYKPGLYIEADVPVQRFPVRRRETSQFDAVNYKLLNNIVLTPAEEEIFMRESVNSPKLYAYIKDHKEEYDLFVFIPYMFGTTYYGSLECLDRAVMIPCFHEESYLHMQILKDVFERAAGIVYNAEPEQKLAKQVFDLDSVSQVVMGLGMDTDLTYSAERFRKKYQIRDPFFLYAGRKDKGKNIDTLLRFFRWFHKLHPDVNLKLILIGGGEIIVPEEIRDCVLDLGFVERQDKYDANAAAMFLCQPSIHESFSIVIMESWLCGRPVLVHENCEVTKDFVRKANGGLYFHDYPEFEECLLFFLSNEVLCRKMGKQGEYYVRNHFDWEVVIEKYTAFFEEVIQKRGQRNAGST